MKSPESRKPPRRVRIVLVRPRNPLNMGAAARAMANFGFDDLVVVNPYGPTWRETVSAVGAEELLRSARLCKSLDEAVGDCQLVFGTTAVRGRSLERTLVRLPNLVAYLEKMKVSDARPIALVFGSEKTGLTEPDLERCNVLLTVPTAKGTPSMNLSHAVAVCCYELAQRDLGYTGSARPLATAEERERLGKDALKVFEASGYLNFVDTEQKVKKIRRALLQWNLHAHDVGMLHGFLRKLVERLK